MILWLKRAYRAARRRLSSALAFLSRLAGRPSPAPKAKADRWAKAQLARLRPHQGPPPAGWVVDLLGVRTQWKMLDGNCPHTAEVVSQIWQQLPAPEVNGLEYYEWVDLTRAVVAARERFVMVELGAGYGRWAVRAARLLQALNPLPCRLVAVESEPTHFGWLREHFQDNGLDPDEHQLVCRPVAGAPGPVHFLVGRASDCYGQGIVPTAEARSDGLATATMDAVTLAEILDPYPRVDLIDLDIQGSELDVLSAAVDVLDGRVKRLQVGTHGAEIERGLRQLFRTHGWRPEWDFACGVPVYVPVLGRTIEVGDGVQTWVNPRVRG